MSKYTQPNENYVKKMFGNIAGSYDITNDALSLGIHRIWKSRTVDLASENKPSRILDCATGTGDLAFRLKKRNPGAEVHGLDFTPEMIEIAKKKSQKMKINVQFIIGDILKLPFEDKYFSSVAIGFGIRNVENLERGIQEMHRVLKPGGRLVVLEFGQPSGPIKYPYKFYSDYIIPGIGKLLTKSRPAYKYLNESSSKFPSGREFLKILSSACRFSSVKAFPQQSGIAYIYKAVK